MEELGTMMIGNQAAFIFKQINFKAQSSGLITEALTDISEEGVR